MTGKTKSLERTDKPKEAPSRERSSAQLQVSSFPESMYGVLGVQRAAGNMAIQRLPGSGPIQAKLAIGTPDDPLENEADRVADHVMQMKADHCHCGRACSEGQAKEEGLVQRKTERQSNTSDGFLQHLGSGQPLDHSIRIFFEPRFDHDLSRVRIHSNGKASESAKTINALAYTIGQNVVFRDGYYSPGTMEGKKLLAHELTHVVQQTPHSSRTMIGIQRQATPDDVAPDTVTDRAEEVATPGLIVEDSVEELKPGQMKKSEFLAQLRSDVCITAEAAMSATGQTTKGCPYLDYWFGYYSNQDSQHIERAIRKYAPETTGVAAARDYIPIITDRVRRAVIVWAKTGEITEVPEGVSPEVSGAGAETGVESAPTKAKSAQFKGREGGTRNADNPQMIQAQLGSGGALDTGLKSRMESTFGYDFSCVRVHTDSNAAKLSNSLNARAFTIGSDIVFASGEYQPGTLIGEALIAHELAHVVQQGGATTAPMHKGGSEHNGLEEDADRSAVGAIVSLWGGVKSGMANITQNMMPRLKSGLRLQRCNGTADTKHRLIISTSNVTPKLYSYCGEFFWFINWNTNGRGGFIVQEMINTYSPKDCTGAADTTIAPTEAPTAHFYEAWQVDARGNVTPEFVTRHGRVNDKWSRPERPDANGTLGSQGDWSMESKVYWTKSLDLAASFRVGAVHDAHDLQSTITRPTNLGSPLLERGPIIGKWDCCGGVRSLTSP